MPHHAALHVLYNFERISRRIGDEPSAPSTSKASRQSQSALLFDMCL